jgi:Golgi-body localisation protein domain
VTGLTGTLFIDWHFFSNKGSGNRNLTDIHEFKLNLPTIDYKNKTWSNLDMALHLKKEIIRILLQHTGSLIQNKLTKHRKKRFNQPLRQISNYVSFTTVQDLAEGGTSSSTPSNGSIANIPRIQVTNGSGTSGTSSYSQSSTLASKGSSSSSSTKPLLHTRNSVISLDKKSFRFNLSPSVSRTESVKTLGNDEESKGEENLERGTSSGSASPSTNSPLKKLRNFTSGGNKHDEDGNKKGGILQKLLN